MTQQVLMIVEKASHRFCYYDMDTKVLLKQIPLPDFPHEFVVTPDEKYAYIGIYGVINSGCNNTGNCKVYVLDIARGDIVNIITVQDKNYGPMYRPHGIETDMSGGLYVLSESGDRLFYKKNPLQGDICDYSVPTGGDKGHLFALTKEGKRAFVSNLDSGNVTAINPHDPDQMPIAVETGIKPEGRCLSPDEGTLYITNRGDNTISVIDVQTMRLKYSFDTPQDPTRVFYNPEQNTIIVIHYLGKAISIYNAEDGQKIHALDVPSYPTALSFNSNYQAILVPFMDRKIRVYDTLSLQQIDEMDTGEEPDVAYSIQKSILEFC